MMCLDRARIAAFEAGLKVRRGFINCGHIKIPLATEPFIMHSIT
jgi:hypothetical protein